MSDDLTGIENPGVPEIVHGNITSVIRTVVPYLVGLVVSWLVSVNVEVNATFEVMLSGVLTFIFGSVYYVVVRWLERKYPALSRLLGSKRTPIGYIETTAVVKND